LSNKRGTHSSHIGPPAASGEVKPDKFVTHHVLFEQVKKEFKAWLTKASGVIKAMVEITG
jgi:threonine dehydrogenase-like Zn-dependent dehydrogenase